MDFNYTEAVFSAPEKRIFDSQGTLDFQKSLAMLRIQYYLQKYITLCRGIQVTDFAPTDENEFTTFIGGLLSRLSDLVDETPPEKVHSRFGNLSYRDWQTKFDTQLDGWIHELIPEKYHRSIIEMRYYIANAFGSKERIDYGTGHELSFLAVIMCLDMLGVASIQGVQILHCFNKYYDLVQKLILTYRLEPAGSHGVWGLDDHFHFSYIIGSTQLLGRRTSLTPRDISNVKLMERDSDKNLFCKSITFINRVKTGPFCNHSPLLYNISRSVHTWQKMQQGLIKMYKAEVLNKFPVVQHFWFGTAFFPWTHYDSKTSLPVCQPNEQDEVSGNTKLSSNLPFNSPPNSTNVTTKMPPPLSTNTARFLHKR